MKTTIATFAALLFLTGCTGIPKDIEPVKDFNVEKYLGQWYEIARLDHRFERGLSNVTATYTLRDDGSIEVLNRGYSTRKQKWNEATGTAKLVSNSATAHLKVSFFGPFYGSYVVFDLDRENYQHAFVTGYNKNFLWLLSRTPTVPDDLLARFKQRVTELGYDVDELIMVDHDS